METKETPDDKLTNDRAEYTKSIANAREAIEIKFVQILSSFGDVLLNKSQVPSINTKKRKAAEQIAVLMLAETGNNYKVNQIFKKIANLKQQVRKKIHKKNGALRESEKLFLNILNSNKATPTPKKNKSKAQTCQTIKPEDPLNNVENSEEDTVSMSSLLSVKEKQLPPANTNTEKSLENLVLENKLQLITMQKSMMDAQEQRQQELHAEQMEVLALKRKVLVAKLKSIKSKNGN